MPTTSNQGTSQYWDPVAIGPVAQTAPALLPAPPANVGAGATYTTTLILGDGFTSIAVAAKLAVAGTLTVQRYLDQAGTIAAGPASSVALAAGVQSNLNINDGVPFQGFTIAVTNPSGGAAALQTLFCLLNAA